jgi:hypothetical protein
VRPSRVWASGGVGGLARKPGALGLVACCGGRVGFWLAEGGGPVLVGGGLAGAGQFVADVAGRPGQFALVGADPDAELPVGER